MAVLQLVVHSRLEGHIPEVGTLVDHLVGHNLVEAEIPYFVVVDTLVEGDSCLVVHLSMEVGTPAVQLVDNPVVQVVDIPAGQLVGILVVQVDILAALSVDMTSLLLDWIIYLN